MCIYLIPKTSYNVPTGLLGSLRTLQKCLRICINCIKNKAMHTSSFIYYTNEPTLSRSVWKRMQTPFSSNEFNHMWWWWPLISAVHRQDPLSVEPTPMDRYSNSTCWDTAEWIIPSIIASLPEAARQNPKAKPLECIEKRPQTTTSNYDATTPLFYSWDEVLMLKGSV